MSGRAERLRWPLIGGPRSHPCKGPLCVKVTRLLEPLIGAFAPAALAQKRSPLSVRLSSKLCLLVSFPTSMMISLCDRLPINAIVPRLEQHLTSGIRRDAHARHGRETKSVSQPHRRHGVNWALHDVIGRPQRRLLIMCLDDVRHVPQLPQSRRCLSAYQGASPERDRRTRRLEEGRKDGSRAVRQSYQTISSSIGARVRLMCSASCDRLALLGLGSRMTIAASACFGMLAAEYAPCLSPGFSLHQPSPLTRTQLYFVAPGRLAWQHARSKLALTRCF